MRLGRGSSLVSLLAVLASAGCRQLLGIDEPGAASDAAVDTAIDATPPLHLTGTTRSIDLTGVHALGGVTLEWLSNDPMVPATTSDATTGVFSIDVPRAGSGLTDGALHATLTGYRPTYLYLPAPFDTDVAGIALFLTTQSTFNQMITATGVTPVMGDGVILLGVVSSQDLPISGAVVTSSPSGVIRYDSGGAPSSSATVTASDGVAYILNLAPGPVSANASKNGLAFSPRAVVTHANATTETGVRALP